MSEQSSRSLSFSFSNPLGEMIGEVAYATQARFLPDIVSPMAWESDGQSWVDGLLCTWRVDYGVPQPPVLILRTPQG